MGKIWGGFCEVNTNYVGRSSMVGRSDLFSNEIINEIGFDPFFTYGSEDTDIPCRF